MSYALCHTVNFILVLGGSLMRRQLLLNATTSFLVLLKLLPRLSVDHVRRAATRATAAATGAVVATDRLAECDHRHSRPAKVGPRPRRIEQLQYIPLPICNCMWQWW
jgi:hypothetical protein